MTKSKRIITSLSTLLVATIVIIIILCCRSCTNNSLFKTGMDVFSFVNINNSFVITSEGMNITSEVSSINSEYQINELNLSLTYQIEFSGINNIGEYKTQTENADFIYTNSSDNNFKCLKTWITPIISVDHFKMNIIEYKNYSSYVVKLEKK